MATLRGRRAWGMTRTREGHRVYHITFRVECNKLEGPAVAIQTPGLPIPGAIWDPDNSSSDEVDFWAWCRLETPIVQEAPDGEPNTAFDLTYTFSTEPLRFDEGTNLGGDPSFGNAGGGNLGSTDPLIEFPKVTGEFSPFTFEPTVDRFNRAIRTSSHEQIRGAQNEWEDQRPIIRVEYNSGSFNDVALVYAMRNHVNSAPLWGFNKRCIRLVPKGWDRQFHGVTRQFFRIAVEFHIKPDGWDRDVLDEGTKVLEGHWDKDPDSATYRAWVVHTDENGDDLNPNNPANFVRFKDWNDENATVVLNGAGVPYNPDNSPQYDDTGFASQSTLTPPTSNTSGLGNVTGLTATARAGGSLVTGISYDYAVTTLSRTGESTGSTVAAPDLSGDNKTVRLAWDEVAGAIGYKVYQKRVTYDTEYYLITTVGSSSTPGKIHVEVYPEANFLLLGIPTIF
jgi:hypothetical protein